LALALICLSGCCNLAEMLGSSSSDDESAEEAKKEKKPKPVKLKASYYDWACAVHPSKKKSIYLPSKDADSDADDDDEAAKVRRLVKELSEAAGTSSASTPEVFAADGVGSAVAVAVELKKSRKGYKKGQRIILFAPKEVSSTADKDLAFVFAHALGHHSLGHSKADSAAELAADQHAGYLLGLQGKPLGDTTSWILAKAAAAERAERLKHATEGWNKGCQKSQKCGATATPTPTPTPPPDSSGPPKKYRSYGDREGI